MTPPDQASALVTCGIAGLAILMAVAVLSAVRRALPDKARTVTIVVVAMMALQLGLAQAGVLRNSDSRPPPAMPLIAITLALAAFAALRWAAPVSAAWSFAALIGAQAFRLPLELVMHQAAIEDVMPVQMSYSGRNFDIVTGASAVIVAALAFKGKAPRWLIIIWNLMGSLLLLNIVTIAVVSMPAFQAFGDQQVNTWIGYPPFIWLPGVLVPAALMGHIVVWRKLFP